MLEAILMLAPALAGVIYGEDEGVAYIITALICLTVGGALSFKKPKRNVFYLKEGCVATALSWVILSLFGCIPFMITKEIPFFINALFETVSGFTTTGSTIIDDVEAMSHASLLWRSETHWIGGMGVLVFIMAVVSLSGGSNINLLKAESPGPSVGKLVPKMKTTARWLYVIYAAFTVAEFLFLVIGKMPVFDALCTALGTAGTGGFGVKNNSIGGYSPYVQWVVTIFMLLFGVNFNAYYFIILRQLKKAFSIDEVKVYFSIVLCGIAIFFLNSHRLFNTTGEALRAASFQTASLVTSTGFTTVDYDTWPNLSKLLALMLMTVGACSGSTGGGIKVSRFIIAFKGAYNEICSYIHPKSVRRTRMDGNTLSEDIIRATAIYIFTFAAIFAASIFIVAIEGHDYMTNFSAVLAEMNNIGPGMSMAGPSETFSFFTPLSKCVFIFDMLAGRLELYPMLLLINPAVWKRS